MQGEIKILKTNLSFQGSDSPAHPCGFQPCGVPETTSGGRAGQF